MIGNKVQIFLYIFNELLLCPTSEFEEPRVRLLPPGCAPEKLAVLCILLRTPADAVPLIYALCLAPEGIGIVFIEVEFILLDPLGVLRFSI